MHTLALSEVEQLLVVVISHLGSPAGSVRLVCFQKTEREVCREQSVPMPVPASLREEQTHGSTGKLHINSAISTPQCPIVLGKSLLLEFLDNLVGGQVAPLGVVLGLAKFDHTYQVALDMTAGNQANEVSTCKPTVNEQIVKSDATLDGILHHLDGLVNLRHRVLHDALLDSLSAMILLYRALRSLSVSPCFLSGLRPSSP